MNLTATEAKILQLFANGYARKQVADSVCRSIKTLDNDIILMKRVNNCKTMPHLVAQALRAGAIK